ncbi:uncharacterized protein LOC115210622 isoform X2 [Argonauta hians]
MDELFEDYTCFQPNHFIVLDSQNSCCSLTLNEISFIKSLPGLQIPQTQTEAPMADNHSTNQNPVASEPYQYDIDLDTPSFSQVSLNFLKKAPSMDKDQSAATTTHSEGSQSHFCKPLQPYSTENLRLEENPSIATAKVPCEKSSSSEDSTSAHTVKEFRETSKSTKVKSTNLSRKFLFKSDQEDTMSEDKNSDDAEVNTPSKHIPSLRVSPTAVIVSDTADELNYIEPSPEHQSFPLIIPDSPTMDQSDQDCCSQGSSITEVTVIQNKKSPEKSKEDSQNETSKYSKDDNDSLHLHYSATQLQSQAEAGPNSSLRKDEDSESTLPCNDICESQDLNLYLSFSSQVSENKELMMSQSQKSNLPLKKKEYVESLPAAFKDSSSEEGKAPPGHSLHTSSFSETKQTRNILEKTSSQRSLKHGSFGSSLVSPPSQKAIFEKNPNNSSDSHTSPKGKSIGDSASDQIKDYQEFMPRLSSSECSQHTSQSLSTGNQQKKQFEEKFQSSLENNPFDSENFFKKDLQKNLPDPCSSKVSPQGSLMDEPPSKSKSTTSFVGGCVSKNLHEKLINLEDLPVEDSHPQTFTNVLDKKDKKSFSIHESSKYFSKNKKLSCTQGSINIRAGDFNDSSKERQKSSSLPQKLIWTGNDTISSAAPSSGDVLQDIPVNMVANEDVPVRLTSMLSQNNNSNAKEAVMPYEEEERIAAFNRSNQMLVENRLERNASVSQPLYRKPSVEYLGDSLSSSMPNQASCSFHRTSRTITELAPVEPLGLTAARMSVNPVMRKSLNTFSEKPYSSLVGGDNLESRSEYNQQDISVVQHDTITNVADKEKQDDATQDLNVGASTSQNPPLILGPQVNIVSVKKRRKQLVSKSIPKKNSKKVFPRKSLLFKDRQKLPFRVRFETTRKRARNPLTLNGGSAFLKVPSHRDIENILLSGGYNKEDKIPSSSDAGSQSKDHQQQNQSSLYTNLKKVLQRKIIEETTVQIVYRKTTVEMLRNSEVINRRVFEEKIDPVVIKSNRNEELKYLNSTKGVPVISSSTATSLTSGEFADVSSLSHSDSKGSSHNSSGSLTVKSSSQDLPSSPSEKRSKNVVKEHNANTSKKCVSRKPCPNQSTDEEMLKMLSPITVEDKQEHSTYISLGDDLQQQSWDLSVTPDKASTSVTGAATLTRYSSSEVPVKTKLATDSNSDSLFSSNEHLNISDQEMVAHHSKNIPKSQPPQMARFCPAISPGHKNLSLPQVSSKPSPRTSTQEDSTSVKNNKSIKKLKRLHCSEPLKTNISYKKRKQDFSDDKSKSSDKTPSPEIPFQDQGNKVSQNVTKKNVQRQQPAIGILVMARWKDSFYYPGKLASSEKTGKCLVQFVDGDRLWVKINQILSITYLPQGQEIMVQSSDGFFDTGTIMNYKYNGSDSDEDVLYQVQMDDCGIVECTRKQLILSEDQAQSMLSDEDFLLLPGIPTTPVASGADVSLDNLVEGSRRSSSRKILSESEKTKKLTTIEPQAMSTPTHKKKASTFRKDCESNVQHIGAAVASPKHNYDGRRARKELFDMVKGPLPKKPLFKGMNFLLTYTERTREQILIDKRLLQESSESSAYPSSSDAEAEPKVPFDKNHLRMQLEAGGGTVFKCWQNDFLDPHKTCFVVSSSYQRTVKYLEGLAAGIPCISHLWIRDCCKEETTLDYRSYILQAGINIIKKCLMESKMIARCLEDLEILVTSNQNEFVSNWSEILTIAGCRVRKKLKTKGSNESLDAIITDASCSPEIIQQAENHHIPLLSSEWVIQCLIHGQKIAYDAHEKFIYNYEGNI